MKGITIRTAALAALAMTAPVAMHAQRGMGPRQPGGMIGAGRVGMNPVAPLIDMRRELNLTSRQLVQLDSIERTLVSRNQVLRDRMRTRIDSARPRGDLTEEQAIAARRAQEDSMRALRNVIVRNDSVARVAAMAVLNDSQRVQVRERMAERRGFEAGRRSRMREGMGERRGPPEFGPQVQPGARGRVGGGGQGFAPRERMRAPDAMGPRGFRRPPPPPADTLS